jgi:hypothetical protein
MEAELEYATVNTEAVEPTEYFRVLKSKVDETTAKYLQDQLDVIAAQIVAAKEVGQQSFLNILSFAYQTIIKEQILLANGINKFVDKEDVKTFLDKVQPQNSIKVIDLSRFPRAIPLKVLKDIKHAQDLNIFDEFLVVFTDLQNLIKQDEATKEFINRNRDPVVFGIFKHDKIGIDHDRFYYITDWEDEYCDLTFPRMIQKMQKVGISNPEGTIGTDKKYVQEIVEHTMQELNKKKTGNVFGLEETKSKSTGLFAQFADLSNSIWDRLNGKSKNK